MFTIHGSCPVPGEIPAAAASEGANLQGIRVLVVEDDAAMRNLLSVVLERAGALVDLAESVSEALDCFHRTTPQVLLSDIDLPDGDGYGLLEKARAFGAGGGGPIPAVAMTAFTGSHNRSRALDAGFNRYFPKPLDLKGLVRTIGALAGRAPE